MRKPRRHNPGAIYHVMVRGNNKQQIFFNTQDKEKYLMLLFETLDKFSAKIHAYCLMPNHIHLLLEVSSLPLSNIMHCLSCRYVKYFNKTHQRSGHLFQGRFKSIVVLRDQYFLTLIRYIHQNPLRAKLIQTLDTPWFSSHFTYLGLETNDNLTQELVRSYFNPDTASFAQEYKTYISDKLDKNEIECLLKQEKLNRHSESETFIKVTVLSENSVRIEPLYSLEKILILCEKEFRVDRSLIVGTSRKPEILHVRNIAITLAYLMKTDSLKKISERFSKSYTDSSRVVNATLQEKLFLINKLKKKLC